MIRVLRFFIGGIFFCIGVGIMDKRDVGEIFKRTIERKDYLIRLSEKHGVYR